MSIQGDVKTADGDKEDSTEAVKSQGDVKQEAVAEGEAKKTSEPVEAEGKENAPPS